MKRGLKIWFFLVVVLISLVFINIVNATDYYVDKTTGNNASDGLTPGTAWQTISKVNAFSFNPGDSILFKKGETWHEKLTVPSSGSAGNPIIFGSYTGSSSETVSEWTQVEESVAPYTMTTDGGSPSTDYGFRTLISGEFSNSGERIRIKLEAHSTSNSVIADSYIGEQVASGDNFDMVSGTITRITWDSGGTGTTISGGTEKWSDWITYDFDHTKNYIISIGSTIYYRRSDAEAGTTWFKSDASGEAATADVTGYDSSSNVYFLEEMEIESTNAWKTSLSYQPDKVYFDENLGTYHRLQSNLNSVKDWTWSSNYLYSYSTSDPDSAYSEIKVDTIDIPRTPIRHPDNPIDEQGDPMIRAIEKVDSTYYGYAEIWTGSIWTINYYTSADGISWNTISAPIFDAGGEGEFDEKGQADPSVIYDGINDWKMWFDAWDGSDIWRSLGYATSTDGINWSKYGAVLDKGTSGEWDDYKIHHPSVVKEGSTYYMYYGGHRSGQSYRIGMATSSNGINWTKYAENPILTWGEDGEFDDNMLRPSKPIIIDGVWYMFYWAYDGSSSGMGLAVSTNGYTWTKKGEFASRHSGNWDDDIQASSPLKEGNLIKIWYGGGFYLAILTVDISDYGNDKPNIYPLDSTNAIDTNSNNYLVFENLQISGAKTANILISGNNNVIRYSDIYAGYDHSTAGSGMGIDITGDNNEIYYNLIFNNFGDGIKVNSGGTGNEIYNNVFYNTGAKYLTSQGLNIDEDSAIRNNIVRNSDDTDININTGKTVTGGYNCFEDASASGPGTYTDSGSSTLFSTNPLWTDSSNNNFTLQSGSPCIDAGTDVGLTQDYAGITVPLGGGPDIGAYEYNDTVAPTIITFSCSPTSVRSGRIITCSCSATDDVDSSPSVSYTVNPLTSSTGTYTTTCTVTDNSENSVSSSISYTVSPLGSGGIPSPTPPSETHSWTKIIPGAATIMKDFDPEIGIKQIQIEVNNEAQDVKIIVTKYDDKPAEVTKSKTGKVYQYIEIDAQNIENELEKATVRFRVRKTWLIDNNLDKEDIAVFKFDESENEWEELTTTYIEEDSDYNYYDVELSSFSHFVISEKETEGVEEEKPIAEEEKVKWWLWVVLGLVIVIAVILRIGGKIRGNRKKRKDDFCS